MTQGAPQGSSGPTGTSNASPGARLPNVRRVVRQATVRLNADLRLRRFLDAAAIGAAVFLIATLVARVVPALGLPPESQVWWWIAAALAAGASALAWFAPAMQKRGELADAIAVDERLDLRDRLSTAMALVDGKAPFEVAAVNDGERIASEASLAGRVRSAFKVQAPKLWWLTPTLLVAAILASLLLPQFDPWHRKGETPDDIQTARNDAQEQVDAVIAKIKENPEVAKALQDQLDNAAKDASTAGEKTPEEIRRDAARKVSEMANKLEDLLKSEQAQQMEALKDQLSSLGLPDSEEARKLAEALKKGDFGQANKALKELSKSIEEAKLSDKQKESLAKALEKMADQLAKNEAEKKNVEEALKKAGLDPQLAANPQALQKALEQAKNLTMAQKEALQKACNAQNGACQQCKQLAKNMSAMASQCKSGSQAGDKANQAASAAALASQLSDLEAQQVMQMAMEAAQGQCKSASLGQCNGPPANVDGFSNKRAQAAGKRPEMPTPTKTKTEQAKGQGDADIIARQLIEGQPQVGESHSVLRQIEGNINPGAEEGTSDDPVPPHLRDAHKHYFGELKKRIEAKGAAPAAPAAPADGAAPAAPAGAAEGSKTKS